MTEQTKPKKGGNVKKAPPGFYLPKEASERLHVTPSVLRRMVDRKEIEKITPPTHAEGFYRVSDVNKLANENALFYLQNISTKGHAPTNVGWAEEDDIQGIFDVVASLWGAENVTPIETHRALYQANHYIDYVVKFRSLVLGYINATPYIPQTLEGIMEEKKRGVDLTSHDVLPYEPNQSYDVYVGIVVRQDIPGHEYYTRRLIFGFFSALCDLAIQQGVRIRCMYALSDQERGIKMGEDLGFKEIAPQTGRFILDMEKAESILIQKYREVLQNIDKQPYSKLSVSKPVSKKISHDPHLDEVLQQLFEEVDNGDTVKRTQAGAMLSSFIDQLAESSQMTLEQQALLRSIHETLMNRPLANKKPS